MIRTELNIYPVNDTIEQYRNNWFQHLIECKTQDYRKEHFSADLQEREI
jgi:hypothetical protein